MIDPLLPCLLRTQKSCSVGENRHRKVEFFLWLFLSFPPIIPFSITPESLEVFSIVICRRV